MDNKRIKNKDPNKYFADFKIQWTCHVDEYFRYY